jgi:hypothetical protein
MWKKFTIIIILLVVASCTEKSGSNVTSQDGQQAPDPPSADTAQLRDMEPQAPHELNAVILKRELGENLAHISFSGDLGDGSPGCKSPIVIQNAANMWEGSSAQKAWLRTFIPKYEPVEHALHKPREDGRKTEGYLVRTADGKSVYVCFDITEYFGVE